MSEYKELKHIGSKEFLTPSDDGNSSAVVASLSSEWREEDGKMTDLRGEGVLKIFGDHNTAIEIGLGAHTLECVRYNIEQVWRLVDILNEVYDALVEQGKLFEQEEDYGKD